jgi:Protein of unknown function (DUF1003)
VDLIPGRSIKDWLVLAGIARALVHRFAEVGAVAQDFVQRALVEWPTLTEGARLRGPGLGAVALGAELADQQERRAEVKEAPEDQADQLGLGRIDHQLPVPDVVTQRRGAAQAVIQAPIIMMSQNRQEARDRLRSENDYRVNLKAELEIRQLHEKLDHLLQHQWDRLVEIQRVQLELMNELTSGRR